MVNRVVATKLTDEEHTKLLDACNTEGCTPSEFIKRAILASVGPEKKDEAIQEKKQHTLRDMMLQLKQSKNQKD